MSALVFGFVIGLGLSLSGEFNFKKGGGRSFETIIMQLIENVIRATIPIIHFGIFGEFMAFLVVKCIPYSRIREIIGVIFRMLYSCCYSK